MPADAEAFERGQTAMFIRESWVIGDIASKAPDLKYATAPLPRGSIVAPVNLWTPGRRRQGRAAWAFALAANEPENLLWLLDNVGWLPNRKDVDYSAVIEAKPAFAPSSTIPKSYKFFTLPAIGPIEEILTRLAARLTRGLRQCGARRQTTPPSTRSSRRGGGRGRTRILRARGPARRIA